MSRRMPETLADYVVVGIAPALIMLLVGSLVFYLIGVFYQGDFPFRLTWVMGLFVMATVCVSRIAMEEGASYATLFGFPLAVVVGIAVIRFVQIEGPLAAISPIINLGLLALIWWCVNKLTWDCTLIDDRTDNSGQGLLRAMGWEASLEHGVSQMQGLAAASSSETAVAGVSDRGTEQPNESRPWWERLLRRKDQPAAHGRWVVYFSVAALPLFGIGQYFIDPNNVAGRRFAFWMLVVYVGSALGLLLSTSFLGLRRYVRKRHLEMPVEMTATWLAVGVTMIVALLMVAAILPRPAPEYSLMAAVEQRLGKWTSPERKANQIAAAVEGAEGSSSASAESQEPDQPSGDGASQDGQGQGAATDGEAKDSSANSPSGDGSRASETNSSSDAAQQGTQQNAGSSDAAAESANQPGGEQSGSGQPMAGEQANAQAQAQSPSQVQSQSQDESQAGGADGPRDRDSSQHSEDFASQDTASGDQSSAIKSSASRSPVPQLGQLAVQAGNLLRYAFYAVLAVLAAWLAWRYRHQLLAAWQQLLRELSELLGWLLGKRTSPADASGMAATEPPPPSFRDFVDPFASGQASRMSAVQLVHYSYEALQAWARDYATARQPGQTPHEFTQAVALEQPAVDVPARQLGEIYSRVAYARATPPAQTAAILQVLWQAMNAAAVRGVAANKVTAGTADNTAGTA